MASKALPSPEVLRQLLRYEPGTGKLFWRERGPEWFTRGGSAAAWNDAFAGREAFTADDGAGYRQGSIFDQSFRAHRIAWAISYGVWPQNHIDHINGDKSDNRLCNLRDASRSENMSNSQKRVDNTSGFKGVSRAAGKWVARIYARGKKHHIGYFDTAEDAAAAYAKASAELHGEFGRVS